MALAEEGPPALSWQPLGLQDAVQPGLSTCGGGPAGVRAGAAIRLCPLGGAAAVTLVCDLGERGRPSEGHIFVSLGPGVKGCVTCARARREQVQVDLRRRESEWGQGALPAWPQPEAPGGLASSLSLLPAGAGFSPLCPAVGRLSQGHLRAVGHPRLQP